MMLMFKASPTLSASTRFVMASETREGGAWDEERLKKLSGGDVLHAEIKHGAEFNFWPHHNFNDPFRFVRLSTQLTSQPRACHLPVAHHRNGRHSENVGRFFDAEAAEET